MVGQQAGILRGVCEARTSRGRWNL